MRCAAARVAAVMNRLAEREQERLQHLPSMEQVHARDEGLGLNLNKLVASISGRLVDVTGGQQAARQQVSWGQHPHQGCLREEGQLAGGVPEVLMKQLAGTGIRVNESEVE